MTIATATHTELREMGYKVTTLRPSGPKRKHLVLTQTKGTRMRTNRRHAGGNIPSEVA
jgi:hypothetical protein